jgi:hypothetical protein
MIRAVCGRCGLEHDVITRSIHEARKNWQDWRDVFEYKGPVGNNPLLADSKRFTHFLNEYSVNRTIRAGKHDRFRQTLAESEEFSKAIQDDTGRLLDEVERHLRIHFGTHDGTKRIVSALSKVAAFVRPERFVAWDRYAKKGVRVVLGYSPSDGFDGYADYLAAFDKAWEGRAGQEIRDYVTRNSSESIPESQPRFLRRILDVYLMIRGGRWQ